MKSQTQLGLMFAATLLLGAGGVVRMTSLPEPGAINVVTPDVKTLPIPLRKSAEELEGNVRFQTEEIGRRTSRFSAQQGRLIEFLADGVERAGFELTIQDYPVDRRTFENVIGVKKGSGEGTIFVGTHYDSYFKSPCGNASASGVAALLEVMRSLRGEDLEKTLVVGFFGTGEKPHTGEETMGANQWLKKAKADGLVIDQAIIVSSFGYFRSGNSLQQMSFPWYIMYPKTSDWVGMYAPFTRKGDVEDALERWGSVTDLPARGFAAPTWMMGVPATDQLPFIDAGIPTVVVSDTGPERDQVFRTKLDDPYHLDYVAMALRVQALTDFVRSYATR